MLLALLVSSHLQGCDLAVCFQRGSGWLLDQVRVGPATAGVESSQDQANLILSLTRPHSKAGNLCTFSLPSSFIISNSMDLLLYAPEYRPNMSSMIRSAEFFGFRRIYIFDQNELLSPPKNKKGRADMEHLARVWTAGAVDHIQIIKVNDPVVFLAGYPGRKVGTLINKDAVHLNNMAWQAEDLILFGSEKDGLPGPVIDLLDAAVYVPSLGHTDCLNVAVTFGIVVEKAVQVLDHA